MQAHAAVQNGLVDITRSCQQVVAELRRECQTISQESTRAIAAVAAARKTLHNSFMTHRSACRQAPSSPVPFHQSLCQNLIVQTS